MRQRSSAWRLTSRRPRYCTNPTLQEPERRISWLICNKLNSVREFTYLGSTIWSNGCIDDELQRRMAKGSASFSFLVKGKIYRAIVLSNLLYGGEVWIVYRRQVKKLHAFMMRHLPSIINILERIGRSSDQKDLRWTGHLMMMSPDRLPKQVLYSQLSSGHRKRGRLCLRFKDTINLKLRYIKTDS